MAAKINKAMFLVVNAMRYDVLADSDARRFLFPNMARLAERGFVRRVVTNAQSTQFVMPARSSVRFADSWKPAGPANGSCTCM